MAARLFTRRGADWTERFPTLRAALAELPADTALLDGEVVYLDTDGRTSFARLASALQGGGGLDARLVYYVFDLPYLNGYDLTAAALLSRKEALRRLLAREQPDARVRYVDHLAGSGDVFFRQACALALEGSISKRADAPYRAGRGRDWRKTKCLKRQEFVVGGFTARADSTTGVGALLVGVHEPAAARCATPGASARAGTTARWLSCGGGSGPLTQTRPPFVDPPRGREARGVTWVRPELVAEIEYLDWSGEGLLRQASFEALREDKPAAEVVRERASDTGAAGAPRDTAGRDGVDVDGGASVPRRPAAATGSTAQGRQGRKGPSKAGKGEQGRRPRHGRRRRHQPPGEDRLPRRRSDQARPRTLLRVRRRASPALARTATADHRALPRRLRRRLLLSEARHRRLPRRDRARAARRER